MRNHRNIWGMGMAVAGVWALGFQAHGGEQHAGDLIIGRDGAGKLKVEFAFASTTALLPVTGLINGWSDVEPGIEALEADEPLEDFFTLAPGASIDFEVVSFQPAFKLYTPGFAQTLDAPGETWTLGGFDFHEHPTWHIDSDDAGFVGSQTVWEATFRLKDTGSTGYTTSDPYTLRFTNLPEGVPTLSEWGLAAMLLLMLTAGTIVHRKMVPRPA